MADFYPRPPGGGRHNRPFPGRAFRYFYPRPPGGGRPRTSGRLEQASAFLSTPSGWRATQSAEELLLAYQFLSTPSGWRATARGSPEAPRRSNFYPRPPGGGRPDFAMSPPKMRSYFYPRPPGGGRLVGGSRSNLIGDFYPRPPGGGRRRDLSLRCRSRRISIHALRVEGDSAGRFSRRKRFLFLSTPSGWRATRTSGHARPAGFYFYPRPPGGGRPSSTRDCQSLKNFYPRPPGGGRRSFRGSQDRRGRFLSTPSGWRATALNVMVCMIILFLSTPSGWRATAFYDMMDYEI